MFYVCRYSTAVGQAVRDCLDLWCRMDADVSLSYSIVYVKSRSMMLKGFSCSDVYICVYFQHSNYLRMEYNTTCMYVMYIVLYVKFSYFQCISCVCVCVRFVF